VDIGPGEIGGANTVNVAHAPGAAAEPVKGRVDGDAGWAGELEGRGE